MLREVSFKLFANYGFLDGCGNIMVAPIFENVISNDFFILVKREKWGIVRNFEQVDSIIYEFEDVKVFDDVLWFKKDGLWGAIRANGDVLVKRKYLSVRLIDDSAILECWSDRYEYFSINGKKVSYDFDIVKILENIFGYALGVGYRFGDIDEMYFVIDAGSGTLFKSFKSKDECMALLEELRSDYVWSKRI